VAQLCGFGLLQLFTVSKQVKKSPLVRTAKTLTIPPHDAHWAPGPRKSVLAPQALVILLWASTYQLRHPHPLWLAAALGLSDQS